MKNKQTSVVFLWEQLKQFLPQNYTIDDSVKMLSILNQAVAMHKEECINLLNTHNDIDDTSEDHYNETIKGGNK
jgi:hypothetical protein